MTAAQLSPLTPGRLLGTWHLDPTVLVVLLLLIAGYLVGVRRVRRRGGDWPRYRTAGFVGLGCGSVVVATMSGLAGYGQLLFWPVAVQNTLLATLTPVCLAVGDPVGLALRCRPGLRRLLAARPVRVATFPLVASLLAVGGQFLIYFTPYLNAALRHPAVRELMYLQLVVTGVLFTVPLLEAEFLPEWCSYPVRAAIAFVDGLVDALPGILVMATSTLIAAAYYRSRHLSWGPSLRADQTIGGAAMVGLAELIALPFLAAMFRAWVRADATEAVELDRRLDREAAVRPDAVTDPEHGQLTLTRPWWETDPGPLADRARRFGWRDDA